MAKTNELLEKEVAALAAEVSRLRQALVLSAMNNHIARHAVPQGSSSKDWVTCNAVSCADVRAASREAPWRARGTPSPEKIMAERSSSRGPKWIALGPWAVGSAASSGPSRRSK